MSFSYLSLPHCVKIHTMLFCGVKTRFLTLPCLHQLFWKANNFLSEVFLYQTKTCVQRLCPLFEHQHHFFWNNFFQSSSSKPASIWFRTSAAAERPIALQVSGVWPNFSALFLAEWKAVEVALWRKVDFLSHPKSALKQCCHLGNSPQTHVFNDCDAEELAAQGLLCFSFAFSFQLLWLFRFLFGILLRFLFGLGPHNDIDAQKTGLQFLFLLIPQKSSKHLLLKIATNLSSVSFFLPHLFFLPSFSSPVLPQI